MKFSRLYTAAVLAAGGVLGWAVASDRLPNWPPNSQSSSAAALAFKQVPINKATCCQLGPDELVGFRNHNSRVVAEAERSGKKPNIVIIWGDDIGQSNISAYSHGVMGYKTPNIDRVAKEGMMFTDYYAEQSCTAGRASFITGQHGLRTGLTKVGLPGAKLGLSKEAPTIAEILKPLGYATGQFGKTIWATGMNFSQPFTASKNSSVTFIT